MKKIYLDNGSSSFPKAPGVGEAMMDFIENVGVNVARGSYESAYAAADLILDTRERICSLFNWDRPENVIFTSGATESMNILLKGFLKAGDHVICSCLEHNAVMRPLTQLVEKGVCVDYLPCDMHGVAILENLSTLIRSNTKLVVMTHASNVCGTINPIAAVGDFCRRHNIRFIVDCAQTAGCLPIDFPSVGADGLVFAGHKGLLGPQGVGGFIISESFEKEVTPLITGGTGSRSDSLVQPDFMPDKFESGTQNIPGILGLRQGLIFLEEKGIDSIRQHEIALAMQLINGIKNLPGVQLIGTDNAQLRTAVVSVDFTERDNADAAYELYDKYGIMTRCGLHCAPLAHKALGTFPRGTVRFVPGWNTTPDEIETAITAIAEIAKAY